MDGDPHGEYHNISEDIKRDEYLQDLVFTGLRFENRFVFRIPYIYWRREVRNLTPPRPGIRSLLNRYYLPGPPLLLAKEGRISIFWLNQNILA